MARKKEEKEEIEEKPVEDTEEAETARTGIEEETIVEGKIEETEEKEEGTAETMEGAEEPEKIEPKVSGEEIERMVEAALFMAARPISMHELISLTGLNSRELREAVKKLQGNYLDRGSWIEILKLERSYLMRLKPEFTERVAEIAQSTELTRRALRVLAVVANNDGILQSRVVKMIGPTTYEGVQELMDKNYLTAEKKGHSKILRLSQKFKTYFGGSEKEK